MRKRRLKTIRQLKNLKGKRVLVRVDFNVSLRHGRVLPRDQVRIKASLPTIEYLIKRGAKVVLVTHLGRPEGKRVAALRTGHLAPVLTRLLGQPIRLLENIRFEPAEEKNDAALARRLAKGADLYVNDAFAVSHRAHASVSAITRYLPSYAGLLLEGEVKNLDRVMGHPKRPFVLVMGGIKIETKAPVIRYLLPRVDKILLGGALAMVVRPRHPKMVFPLDARGRNSDIGPRTERLFSDHLRGARTIVWNGPLGKIEDKRYRKGTMTTARAILREAKRGAYVVIGGGDTIAAVEYLFKKLPAKRSWISTGGGAMLQYLSGKSLPGLKNLIS